MLTEKEKTMLEAYRRGLGVMTAAAAMVESLWNDDMANKMPVQDPASTRYKNESNHYLNYAALLEKMELP